MRSLRCALAAIAILTAACSGGNGEGRSATASDGTEPLEVGFVLLDLESLAPLGLTLDGFELDTQREAFEVYIDAINAEGGIGGRSIEPTFVVNDPLDADTSRAGCLELTEDEGVFAVVGFVTEAIECITIEHATPLVFHSQTLARRYTDSAHRLVSPLASLERSAAAWAAVMDQRGDLDGATIAILSVDDGADLQLTADSLQSTLEQLGHPVEHRVRVTAATDAAAIALEVPTMRAAGVDTVFLATDFATAAQLVRVAEEQGFLPQYLTSEIGAMSADGLVRRMPTSFDGAIGVTSSAGGALASRVGETAPAASAECLDQYNEATGSDLEWGVEHSVSGICQMMRIFEAAANRVDGELTPAAFADAVQQLGDVDLPERWGGAFAPGKTDYADVYSVVRWSAACTCYESFGDPVAVG